MLPTGGVDVITGECGDFFYFLSFFLCVSIWNNSAFNLFFKSSYILYPFILVVVLVKSSPEITRIKRNIVKYVFVSWTLHHLRYHSITPDIVAVK